MTMMIMVMLVVSVKRLTYKIALTIRCKMSQNGQTHFKNLAANFARFINCVLPFWDIMHERVKPAGTIVSGFLKTHCEKKFNLREIYADSVE